MPDEQVLLIVIRLEGKCMAVVSEGGCPWCEIVTDMIISNDVVETKFSVTKQSTDLVPSRRCDGRRAR